MKQEKIEKRAQKLIEKYLRSQIRELDISMLPTVDPAVNLRCVMESRAVKANDRIEICRRRRRKLQKLIGKMTYNPKGTNSPDVWKEVMWEEIRINLNELEKAEADLEVAELAVKIAEKYSFNLRYLDGEPK